MYFNSSYCLFCVLKMFFLSLGIQLCTVKRRQPNVQKPNNAESQTIACSNRSSLDFGCSGLVFFSSRQSQTVLYIKKKITYKMFQLSENVQKRNVRTDHVRISDRAKTSKIPTKLFRYRTSSKLKLFCSRTTLLCPKSKHGFRHSTVYDVETKHAKTEKKTHLNRNVNQASGEVA